MRIKVLASTDYYLPSYKAGGPIRTISNVVKALGEEIDFNILTRDRDINDQIPFPLLSEEQSPHKIGNANVYYLPPKHLNILKIYKTLSNIEYNLLYLNSFFSFKFTITLLILRRFGFINKVPTILAPRGEFSDSALKIKKRKKTFYLSFAKKVGLLEGIVWQASSNYEENDIKKVIGPKTNIIVAPDLFVPHDNSDDFNDFSKNKGELSIIFLSRIVEMKNLLLALDILKSVTKGKITFNIYGPIEDKLYWEKCQKTIQLLPQNIKVNYKGEISTENVFSVIKKHHLFFLPTLGENFGHVIIEALSCRRLILISDRTPWRQLEEKGIGWDIALNKLDEFRGKIELCLQMDQEEYRYSINRIDKFMESFQKNNSSIVQTQLMFQNTISSGGKE